MKSRMFTLIGLVGMLSVIGLSSCGEENTDPMIYNITYDENENYRITGLSATGQEGSTILFSVHCDSVFYEIGDVTYNGKATEVTDLGYKFIMPSEDVKVEIDLVPITEYDNPNDNLSWASDVDGNIVIPDDIEDNQYATQRINLNFDNITTSNMISVIDDEIQTSNEEVIPSDAITFKGVQSPSISVYISGYLEIDLTKVKEGKSSIYVSLDPNNSKLGTLIKEFNVVKESEYEPETMPVTLTFENNSSADDKEIFINIYEKNSMDPFYSLSFKDLDNGKFEMEYLVGHQYFVTAGYRNVDNSNESLSFLSSVWSLDENSNEQDYLTRDGNYHRFILTLKTPGINATLKIVDLY